MMAALQIKATYELSYWDAAIIAAARALGCSEVLTEDMSHGREIGGVISPTRFAEYRLRVGEVRVFYDISGTTIQVLAIVAESETVMVRAKRKSGVREVPLSEIKDLKLHQLKSAQSEGRDSRSGG